MIFKGLVGKRTLALRLRFSSIFFASPPRFHSPLGNDHLIIRNKINRHVQTKVRSTNNGHPMPSVPLRKRKQYHYSRVPRRWLLSFPSGVKLLVLFAAFLLVFGFAARLQENGVWCCRRCIDFGGGKVFPPKFEPTPTSKQPSAVARPVSPFRGHCCPGISRPVPADGDSSSVGTGFILPSSFFSVPSFFFFMSTRTHASSHISGVGERGLRYCAVSAGATVACAASGPHLSTNRLSMANSVSVRSAVLCPIASVKFTVLCPISLIKLLARWLNPSFTGGIDASFNAFKSDHKLAANCSGVRESE